MKMMIRKIFGTLFAFAIGVSFFSCSDVETGHEHDTKNCIVRLSVSTDENAERTALPETLELEKLTYTLTATVSGTSENPVTHSWGSYAEMRDSELLFDVGSWNFTLTALKGSVAVLTGTNTSEITRGENSISFDLTPPSTGTGSLSMSLTGITGAATVSATLCKVNGTALTASDMGSGFDVEDLSQSWNLTAEEIEEVFGTVTFTLSNVPKGSYMLVWTFTIGNANSRTIRPVAVVEPGRCSSESYDVNENASGVAKYYSVTYEDGVSAEEIEVPVDPRLYKAGETVTVMPAIERANYNFTGWRDLKGNSSYTPNASGNGSFAMPARSVTLTADWQAKEGLKYKVEHYQQIINPVSEAYNGDNYVLFFTDSDLTGTAGLNTNATSKGYTGFSEGFTVGANGSADDGIVQQSIYDYGEDVTNCTVIKVYYNRNVHSVTYVGLKTGTSAGEGETITVPISRQAKYQESVPIDFAATRTGYSFNKWVRNDGTEEQPGTEYINPLLGGGTYALTMFDSDIVLTAVWTPNENTEYKVEHYKQNLDSADVVNPNEFTYTYSETDELKGTTADVIVVTPKNYSGFTYIEPTVEYPIRGDGETVVKVYYTRNTHTVTYNVNQGGNISVPADSTRYRYGAPVTVSFTTDNTADSMYNIGLRSGYTFLGWSTDNNATEATYKKDGTTSFEMGDSDVTLYAIWKANVISGGAIEVNPPSYSAVDLGLDYTSSTSGTVVFTANTGNENYTWQTYTWYIDGSPVVLTDVTTEDQTETVSYEWDYSEWEADGYNIMLVVTDADSHVYTATMYVTITK